MRKARIVILASGAGSIAQSIFEASFRGELPAEIVGLICDQPGAQVLTRAAEFNIKSFLLPMQQDRKLWDKEVFKKLDSLQPDLVVSAGFMRILAGDTVSQFRIVNSHPALLPLFPGAHAVRDALAAGATQTGTTIHWVDSDVDTGEIIAQEAIEIAPTDTQESLHERIKIVERRLYVATLQLLLNDLVRS
ncbi:phosphoribosylglycinamide formyltransferase [Actinobacteria bacterium IMCC26103]|nr:phosphoribosylglycinamide formyltransferase [Actinobacteria bacterium IMCC26103]